MFGGTILPSVTWVASVIRAIDARARIMPATQATRGILYLGNKMASCDCLKVALCH